MNDFAQLLARAESVLARLEAILPVPDAVPDLATGFAFRWRKRSSSARGYLQAVPHLSPIALSDLQNIKAQKAAIEQNTEQFVAGRPANNVLLTGARGTGKSSLVKVLLPLFAEQGLRIIEVDKSHLADLPLIVEWVVNRPERFILFCDDLSFSAHDDGYKTLKVALDGGISRRAANLLVYATSNRRHLLPESMNDNLGGVGQDGEVHPAEAVEEKVSLSDRFGLWLSFYPFDQQAYLAAAAKWVRHLGLVYDDTAERAAL